MNVLNRIIDANQCFVERLPCKFSKTIPMPGKMPLKQLAVLTCMDTRLVDFLEPALDIKREDAVIIKNAGNSIDGSVGLTIRSLLLAIYELGVKEILVIGHDDCGAAHAKPAELKAKMLARGVSPDVIKLIDETFSQWLDGINNPEQHVPKVVGMIRTNPLIPTDIFVHGLIFDCYTGKVHIAVNGYDKPD